MQRPATPGCPAAFQQGLPGEDVTTNNMYMEREDQQALPNQLPNSYMAYNSYRFPVGMNFYEATRQDHHRPIYPNPGFTESCMELSDQEPSSLETC